MTFSELQGAVPDWEWQPIGPPSRGSVGILAVTRAAPGTILALSDSSIEVTYDGGQTWRTAGLGQVTVGSISALGIDPFAPATFYAGTDAGLLYRSTDAGRSWSRLNSFPEFGLTAPQIAFSRSGAVFVGTVAGVVASFDGGATWALVAATSGQVSSVAIDRNTVGVGYAAADRLYRTVNGGSRWSPITDTLQGLELFAALSVDEDRSATVYATAICTGCPINSLVLVDTRDAGESWRTFLPPPAADHVGVSGMVASGSTLFVGLPSTGVFRSVDEGVNWLGTNVGLTDTNVLTLVSDGVSIYAGTSSGVFRAPVLGPCGPLSLGLCLSGGRFRVEAAWRSSNVGGSGAGQSMPLTTDTGAFWFFQPSNIELVVKVLDGRTVNGKFWVFYGALSNVEYTITVTDTVTGVFKTYFNPEGTLASVADTDAF